MKKIIYSLFTLLIVAGIFSCTSEVAFPEGQINDITLYQKSIDTTGQVYYQNGTILAPAGGSPHGNFKLRFNPKAASVLDGTLELPTGQTFPDSSLLVKEALDANNNLAVLALMYKYKGSWIWAEYGPTGNTLFSFTQNGSACIPCHSGGANRDLVRTFDVH